MQGKGANSSVGVQLQSGFPAGDVVRQLTINPWDFTSYADIIAGITDNFPDSCEYFIEYFESNNVPTKQLVLNYPRVGSPIQFSSLQLDYPGNITSYTYTENANNGANVAWATGDGDGSSLVVGNATDVNSLSSGYPFLDIVNSFSGVTVQATINAHAANELATSPMPKIAHTFVIAGNVDPVFGSYGLGDDARILIYGEDATQEGNGDPRFPDGLDELVRVVGWSVQAPDAGTTEQVTMILQSDSSTTGVGGGI
jgi:hypothetical protein